MVRTDFIRIARGLGITGEFPLTGLTLERFGAAVEAIAIAAEREQHVQWKRELRQMAEDSADRGDAFAQRVLRALDA